MKPLASLRITVTLLVIACILVLAGTTAQRDMGIQDVQHEFFHSWIAHIQFHYFQPSPKVGSSYIPGWLPLPGGFTLIFLLLINLLAAHTVRFKFNRRRTGVILIHLGLILLLVGEWVTAHHAIESRMTIDVGGAANYAEDIREAELAVVDPSPADHENVVAIPQANLENSVRSTQPIHDSRLPFDVKVDRWFDNANLRGPMEQGKGVEHLATAGAMQKLGLEGIDKFAGTESEHVDMPSAFVTFSKNGKALGTYVLSTFFDRDKPQELEIDAKPYQVSVRFRRYYKPYTVTLNKFTHDVFPGTDTPRNFASEIRLLDPARHVDRQVKIWMNHPLRFAGETFYQQSFANQDRTSILQVVDNPGFWMPYVACAIGALGMVLHFGMNLTDFLRRKFAAERGTVAGARAGRAPAQSSREDRYTLKPEPRWATLGIPAAMVGICLIYVIGKMAPVSHPASSYDWASFGGLPIQFEGRTQPIDSWARNSLNIVSGRQVVRDDKAEELTNVPPEQWLLETMSLTGNWDKYKVVRIDHPEIKQQLGLPINEKYFSWSDVFKNADNPRLLDEQARRAGEVPVKERDAYQNQMIELHQRLGIFLRLRQVDAISFEYTLVSHPEHVKEMFEQVKSAIATVDPQLIAKMQAGGGEDLHKAFNDALMRLDTSKLTTPQRQAIEEFIDQSERTSLLRRLGSGEELYLAAPLKAGEQWQPLSSAVRETDGKEPPAAALAFLNIVQDYIRQSPGDFNADIASYQAKLQAALPTEMAKVDYETFFNHFDPFTICAVFYVTIFVMAMGSWLIWRRPLSRTAYGLLALTFLVHTFGIASRIYLSGRPPVTNLYSASVFIGWAVVLFCIALEGIFRNGIAMVAGSTAGFLTMLVAAGLSSVEGDTMKQLQAVLDTNFWLATHVVCVTLGYTATYLAGLLAIIYILRGVFSPGLTKEASKDNAKMVYGILCFAMLFSFVGTILGGIWADQSWGRFWGWDPKENGAVLVVLWNALILHARWGGLVRERGVMVLAIFGNIVTSWSFFGTNMLGIGLHSYGFMQSAQFWLTAFCFSQLVLAAIGLIPLRLWASFAKSEKPAGNPVLAR